jgi:phosphate transport system substrate-binding protein
VIVEATGTGAGMKLFCEGVGDKFPDITDASRAIKASEYADCTKNGVRQVIEQPIGIDGLTLIENKSTVPLNLTQLDLYKALAANPFGKPNAAKSWKDVNPALPDLAIRVLGPSPISGTRDTLADLILEKGCDTDPAMQALKKSDEKKHKDICTKIREDGPYVEIADNPNLLVQKISQDDHSLGVLGYSYLAANADKVKAAQLAGITPTEETIANLTYPGSRKLFIYVKGDHFVAKPKLKDFLTFYSKQWAKGGMLEKKGLVTFSGTDAQGAATQAEAMKPLDPAGLK